MAKDGTAVFEDGCIVIRMSMRSLQTAILDGGFALGYLDKRWKITDRALFAKELASELNRDDEDGTTSIHRLFDAAVNSYLESNSDGIDEHPKQDI